MKYVECFRSLARHRTDQIVITSAGNSGQAWWLATGGDSKASFYLDASMSLSTMFASGFALARPAQKVWAFMGDGGFCMNPGMLMVERQMNLPNLTHFMISNRAYGACSNASLPNMAHNDYTAMARGMGLTRIFEFDSVEKLDENFGAVLSPNNPGHTFVVLEVEPFSDEEQKLQSAGLQAGPELKFRFGRHLEATYGYDIFDYKL